MAIDNLGYFIIMIKPRDPRELAEVILSRSVCSVQVGAALIDRSNRVVSWGWNSVGPNGFGLHAEHHALLRANPRRKSDTIIYVAAVRKKSGNAVLAKPCEVCQGILVAFGVAGAFYRTASGLWEFLSLAN